MMISMKPGTSGKKDGKHSIPQLQTDKAGAGNTPRRLLTFIIYHFSSNTAPSLPHPNALPQR